jgi:hypothetical protein
MNRVLFLLVCLVSGIPAFTQQTNLRTITYNGNEIITSLRVDAVQVIDPRSGQKENLATGILIVQKLNGKDVHSAYRYGLGFVTPPRKRGLFARNNFFFDTDLSMHFQKELKEMVDPYFIVVIDEEGKLACFSSGNFSDNETLHPKAKEIENKLASMKFAPAEKNGKPVPYAGYLRAYNL